MSAQIIPAGTWVQVRQEILAAGERAPQVPADTAATPLVLLVKGFLTADSSTGERAFIRTVSGRELAGELVQALPRYTHDFGRPVPELMHIGRQARQLLARGEKDD